MRSRELTAAAVNRIRTPAGIIGMIVLMLLGAACSGNGGITEEDLTGTWRVIDPGSFLQLSDDGTYRIALSAEDLENTTVEQGQFTLEGTLFTFISSDESRNCASGQRGIYEMEVLEEGPSGEDRMRMIQVEDECSLRGSLGDVTLERVP